MDLSHAGPLNLLRVDQVGSLLRPAELKDVLARYGDGRADGDELARAEDDAIRAAVARQDLLGLPVVTDGEFRRLHFHDSFAACVTGLAGGSNTFQFYQQRAIAAQSAQDIDPQLEAQGPAIIARRPLTVTDRIRLIHNLPLKEFAFARGVTTRPVKVTLLSVDRIAQRYDADRSNGVYTDIDQFIGDVVAVQKRIVDELVTAGCPYVQIDAPSYTAYLDATALKTMRARGEHPDISLDRSIHADNAVIGGRSGCTFAMHLCRGNARVGSLRRSGSYDAIAERLFNTLAHRRLLLEYDTEESGGFEPLRFVPDDKVVVLGLISTKTPTLESPDALKRRIDEASKYMPLERLALSPQCGFASSVLGNPVSEDVQWRKFEMMLKVAAEVWG